MLMRIVSEVNSRYDFTIKYYLLDVHSRIRIRTQEMLILNTEIILHLFQTI